MFETDDGATNALRQAADVAASEDWLDEARKHHFVFVGGMPQSGTSFTRQLLVSVPGPRPALCLRVCVASTSMRSFASSFPIPETFAPLSPESLLVAALHVASLPRFHSGRFFVVGAHASRFKITPKFASGLDECAKSTRCIAFVSAMSKARFLLLLLFAVVGFAPLKRPRERFVCTSLGPPWSVHLSQNFEGQWLLQSGEVKDVYKPGDERNFLTETDHQDKHGLYLAEVHPKDASLPTSVFLTSKARTQAPVRHRTLAFCVPHGPFTGTVTRRR